MAMTSEWKDLWQVQLGGTGCLMTRAELDAALARADLSAGTLVREPGTLRWTKLGVIAGIEMPPSTDDVPSEGIILSSHEVELVASNEVRPPPLPASASPPSSPAPRSAADADADMKPLTKEELAVAQPRGFVPQLFVVATAAFVGGIALADHYMPGAKDNLTSSIAQSARAAGRAIDPRAEVSAAPPPSPPPPAPPAAAPPAPVLTAANEIMEAPAPPPSAPSPCPEPPVIEATPPVVEATPPPAQARPPRAAAQAAAPKKSPPPKPPAAKPTTRAHGPNHGRRG